MEIKTAIHDADILKCWKVIYELRPHLKESEFTKTIKRIQNSGYQLVYIEENNMAIAAAGFVIGEKLHRGKHIYIDDLSTLPAYRNKGYGGLLLNWIFELAKKEECKQVHLDSGVQRFDAHRLYLKKGFNISSHHFAFIIK